MMAHISDIPAFQRHDAQLFGEYLQHSKLVDKVQVL